MAMWISGEAEFQQQKNTLTYTCEFFHKAKSCDIARRYNIHEPQCIKQQNPKICKTKTVSNIRIGQNHNYGKDLS